MFKDRARFTLTVPTTYPDRAPDYLAGNTARAVHEVVRQRLTDIAGGFTCTSAVGGWRSPSQRIDTETVKVYAVDVDSPHADDVPPKLRSLALWVKESMYQDAVYLTRQPIAVELLA